MLLNIRESINRLILFNLSKKKNIFHLMEANILFNKNQYQMPIAFLHNCPLKAINNAHQQGVKIELLKAQNQDARLVVCETLGGGAGNRTRGLCKRPSL